MGILRFKHKTIIKQSSSLLLINVSAHFLDIKINRVRNTHIFDNDDKTL